MGSNLAYLENKPLVFWSNGIIMKQTLNVSNIIIFIYIYIYTTKNWIGLRPLAQVSASEDKNGVNNKPR